MDIMNPISTSRTSIPLSLQISLMSCLISHSKLNESTKFLRTVKFFFEQLDPNARLSFTLALKFCTFF